MITKRWLSAICVHLLPYQFFYLIENYISLLWSPTVVSILVSYWKLYQPFVFKHKRLICFSLRYKTRLDTAMNEHMSLSLLLAVPGGWVYFRFLAGFMVVSLFLCRSWLLKTISAICGHLLSYQFLYLSENCISNLCSFTAVSILLPDWKLQFSLR
jgi:hypothetical protein